MSSMFIPATRRKLKLRMALCSPAGYGKTYTGLRLAYPLAAGGKVAVIDTEHGAASKYKGLNPDGVPWNFDVCELQHFAPTTYTAAIKAAVAAGYTVLLIDSLSHAWDGVGGALDQVDHKAANGGNSFTAWKDVTPQHREMIETILAAKIHIIATMRTKMEYVLEEQTKNGRKIMVPKKVGMKPVQREGMDYEFDVVADLDESHTLIVGKTRCSEIDGQRVVQPGPAFVGPLLAWLDEGEDSPPTPGPVFTEAIITPVSATSAPAITPADTTTSTADATTKCSEAQRNDIIALAKEIGMDAHGIKAAVQKRGCQKLADLTWQQATEVLAKLRQKQTKKEADKLFP